MTHRTRASPRTLTSIRARLAARPLAIEVNALESILAILGDRSAGATLTADEAEALRAANPYGAASRAATAPRAQQVAVIPLYGPMLLHAGPLEQLSGATDTRAFAAMVREAADDPSVAEIILDVDSPGGSVDAVDTAVAAVRHAASQKPVTAITEGTMASAAYWVASQADRIIATPNAAIGSISVIYTHTDLSEAYASEGIHYTLLTSGDKKAVGNTTEPLSDDAKAEIMRMVGAYHDAFVSDVAAGRGRDPARVQSEWADGRVEVGATALQLGMIDELGTLADALTNATRPPQPTSSRGGAVKLSDVAAVLRNAPRIGAEQDDPEGARTIELSDTLANEMADSIDAEQVERAKATKAAQTEARRALATQALEQAALTPVSEDSDAAFQAALEQAAITASDDTAAATAVTALIEDRAAILTAAKGDNHPNLPAAKESTAAREAEAELRRIRRATRLPN